MRLHLLFLLTSMMTWMIHLRHEDIDLLFLKFSPSIAVSPSYLRARIPILCSVCMNPSITFDCGEFVRILATPPLGTSSSSSLVIVHHYVAQGSLFFFVPLFCSRSAVADLLWCSDSNRSDAHDMFIDRKSALSCTLRRSFEELGALPL